MYLKCELCGVSRSVDAWRTELGESEQSIPPVCYCIDEGSELKEVEVPFALQQLNRLDEIKKQKSELEKEEKKLAPKVKSFLVDNKISSLQYEHHNLVIKQQDRSTMDEDKVVALIKELMSPEEIQATGAIKEISNPEAITTLVKEGRVTMEQLGACRIENIVYVFSVNPKQKKELKSTESNDAVSTDKKGEMF